MVVNIWEKHTILYSRKVQDDSKKFETRQKVKLLIRKEGILYGAENKCNANP